jgi:H+-translocating NAD(P) transhydrogenase subunit alpha
MRLGVPKETAPEERRVALVPETVGRLPDGVEVVVEAGAGDAASFDDEAYRSVGATVGDPWLADIVAKVAWPTPDEVPRLRSGQAVIGFLGTSGAETLPALAAAGVQAFALESVPRITRAQPIDALSSQATVAGYKAVLLAADRLPRFFPMLTTAAGTVAPAKVLVVGAGVAGLQAIATARRLGAVVSAFDVRPAVAEQVRSLGATFLDLGVEGEETEGGYARELTSEQQGAQQAALQERIPGFDVLVTTAAIPGRPAPKLVTEAAVREMHAGAVIVDLAADTGGNCELTERGREVVVDGVTIVGLTNVPSLMPTHASQLLSRNVAALVALLVRDGELAPNWDDEIVSGSCVTREVVAA